jgi:hypothetical protein
MMREGRRTSRYFDKATALERFPKGVKGSPLCVTNSRWKSLLKCIPFYENMLIVNYTSFLSSNEFSPCFQYKKAIKNLVSLNEMLLTCLQRTPFRP